MKKKIAILGAGHIGKAMAIDLNASGYDVIVVDNDINKLEILENKYNIQTRLGNFSDPDGIKIIIEDVDLVVGAVPGKYGYRILRTVIESSKNMVDISFCPEDSMELDSLAKKNNVTIITDMGVAPGMCNLILGYHDSHMTVSRYKCLVGGLPVKREWPLEYKASWSPIDVIEEYTRPARFRENGKLITKPALSDAELINLDPVGTLEEWNSDGLRSLLTSMPHIPDMVEKTLRYPGTINYLRALRELGYFSDEIIDIKGLKIKPIDITAALLFPKWQLLEGELEFTIMKIDIEGIENEEETKYSYLLYDEYDTETKTLSMARTTGYACTAVVELVLPGKYCNPGINPPEFVGRNESNFRSVIKFLADRKVHFKVEKTTGI